MKNCNEAGQGNKESQLPVQCCGALCSSGAIEAVPKTPSCCNAARIRSYSAFRRSQRKNKSQAYCNLADKGNNSSLCYTRTPLEEISFNSTESTLPNSDEGCNQEQEMGHSADDGDDDDIHWKSTNLKNQHNVVEMSQSVVSKLVLIMLVARICLLISELLTLQRVCICENS